MSGLSPARRVARVLVVEDSAVIRRLLAHIIAGDPRLELAGAVESAEEALLAIPRLLPDVISMDIRLPGMDGLEATRRIMALYPTPIVVIADGVEDAALRISMNALRSGALAVVQKPGGVLSRDYAAAAGTIATQLAIMSQVPVIRRRQPVAAASARRGTAASDLAPDFNRDLAPVWAEPARAGVAALAVAASTGGPPALARLLGALPAAFPLPVLLVQHMGATFIEGFAGWLDGLVPMQVALARHDEPLRPGRVLVAPGDRHLGLAEGRDGQLRARLDDRPPLSGQRPSATLLFESLVPLGQRGIGILLTGMGEDGATGLVAMRRAGAFTITEDESSCVVYGMPGAAMRQGGSCASLPLEVIAPRLLQMLPASRA